MSFFPVSRNNSGDRGPEIMQARKNEAAWKIVILVFGIVACLGIFAADIWFSYEPLYPVVGELYAWALAFVTTPIEVAGAMILGQKNLSRSMKENKIDFGFLITVLIIATIGDIASNFAGLANQARTGTGAEPTTIMWVAIIAFGIIMAGVEILISWFLKSVAVAQRAYKDASSVLEELEKQDRVNKRASGRHGRSGIPNTSGKPMMPAQRRNTPRTAPLRRGMHDFQPSNDDERYERFIR